MREANDSINKIINPDETVVDTSSQNNPIEEEASRQAEAAEMDEEKLRAKGVLPKKK
jgi:hypothetical protein